ncbi:hypothetical protein GIB67_006718 [Kingdonia uniflora]|uniref:Thioredoxin domain-containing protein n=1 Tax=Kingdonia uniflora TaxID=39325 RepID=A0A7J7LYP9_9MAGN|nr:hypothetical protein GIB67_006718 [Kingdonia uniflora]
MGEVLNKVSNLISSSSSSSSPCLAKHKSMSVMSCLRLRSSERSEFHGQKITLQPLLRIPIVKAGNTQVVSMQMGLIGRSHKWWEKGIQTNMKEITSAQDYVDSITNAGDRLVIVDFFSPGCGGCKALHPKMCQLAEQNPDVQFLQVNYENLKSMCYSLNVHVLPFFRFYRGAHGRVCSFSCTNATIKKFRDALAKHTTDRCSIGPTKGLEESELLALAANKDLSFSYTPKLPSELQPVIPQEEISRPKLMPDYAILDLPHPSTIKNTKDSEEKSLVTSGR